MKTKSLSSILLTLFVIFVPPAPLGVVAVWAAESVGSAWIAASTTMDTGETKIIDPAKKLGLPDEYENPNWKTGTANAGWSMDQTGRKSASKRAPTQASDKVDKTKTPVDRSEPVNPAKSVEKEETPEDKSKVPDGERPESD